MNIGYRRQQDGKICREKAPHSAGERADVRLLFRSRFPLIKAPMESKIGQGKVQNGMGWARDHLDISIPQLQFTRAPSIHTVQHSDNQLLFTSISFQLTQAQLFLAQEMQVHVRPKHSLKHSNEKEFPLLIWAAQRDTQRTRV